MKGYAVAHNLRNGSIPLISTHLTSNFEGFLFVSPVWTTFLKDPEKKLKQFFDILGKLRK